MAKPPVPSVVQKSAAPTPAQSALAHMQATQQLATYRAQMRAAATGNALPFPVQGKPAQVNDQGFVANPASAVSALVRGVPNQPNRDPGFSGGGTAKPKAAKPAVKPHVTVTVHPNGKIELTHGPTPAAPATSSAASPPALGPKAPATSQAPDVRTAPPKPARTPATASAPAAPLTVEQQAQQLLDPVKQSILDAINQRVNNQQSAITGYAKDLAQMMGSYGPAAGADYGNAISGQSAIDAALAQTLQGAGASGQADLATRLAQIDADPGTAARLNATAAGNTQGAVGAAAGRGSSALSQLVGDKANAQDYAAKLPGLAGLYGLQATKNAQAQGTTDTANAVSQLEQQLPGVVQTLKTDTNQNKQLRFEHGVALLNANGGVVTPQIKALLGGTLPVGPAAKTAPKADSTLSKAFGYLVDAGGNPILRGGQQVPLPKSSTTTTRKANAALSKSLGYVVDNSGEPILQGGKKTMLPKPAVKVSATSTRNTAKALGLARIGHASTTDSKGVVHPAVSWQQYLSTGLSQGIDAATLIKQGKRVYTQREIKLGLIPGVNGG